MKLILFVCLTLTAAAAGASPVNTFAVVVDAPGSSGAGADALHTGQQLPESTELSVPAGARPVDLQLTGDATFAAKDTSPLSTVSSESVIRVEPGSAVSLSKLEATDTGIGTVHEINLRLVHGSVLVSARRFPEPSAFNLLAPAGRISVAEGTVRISEHSIAVSSGRAEFYPRGPRSTAAAPVILTSGHAYDTDTHALSILLAGERSAMKRQAAEFHPVGGGHLSSDDDHTEDCISPIHPGHHHHRHHHHHDPNPNHDHGRDDHPSPWDGFPGQDGSGLNGW
jgi:hypothetical protein